MNKQGLGREIPSAIRREVRQRSKFGCVVCRQAICQYEHISPTYADANEHDPKKICLLCGRCHDKVTRGLLSKETVAAAYARTQSAVEIRRPFDSFDLAGSQLRVILGSSIFHSPKSLIELDGQTILAIEPPEVGSSFPTLSGRFSDKSGAEFFSIEQNIWSSSHGNWDVEIVGNQITVRHGPGEIALRLIANPPNEIVVETLDLYVGTAHLCLRKNSIAVGRMFEDSEYYLEIERLECDGASIGVKAELPEGPTPRFLGMRMTGGEGIDLVGTGLKVAVGSGSMTIRGLTIEVANLHETVRHVFPLTSSILGEVVRLPPRLFKKNKTAAAKTSPTSR